MNPVLIERGKRLPGWLRARPEGNTLNFDCGGVSLVILLHRPVLREVEALKNQPVTVALLPVGRHTLFFLFRIPNLTYEWSDCPFALGLVAPERRRLPDRKPGAGYALPIIMADATTGVVQGIRMVTLSPSFSLMLEATVADIAAALPVFTPEAHDREIRTAYDRWPHSNRMAADAMFTEIAGRPFPP